MAYLVEADVAFEKFCKVDSIALVRKVIRDESELSEKGYVPGSPEYDMRRCGLRTFILSSSLFIFTIERAATVSAATIT